MQEEYRGFVIKYNKSRCLFETKIGDNSIDANTLKGMEDKIDNHIKKEAAFDKIDILCLEDKYGWGKQKLVKGQITSIADSDKMYFSVWVSVNGQRSKRKLTDMIFLDTPDNVDIYSQIQDKEAQIKEIEREIKSLYASMTKPDLTEKAKMLER